MKVIKLSLFLGLAVALTVTATGCKKKPTPLTPLPPGSKAGPVGGDNPSLPKGGTFDPNTGGSSSTGGIPGTDKWNENDPNIQQDEGRFAAQTVYFAFDSSSVKSGEQSKVAAIAAAMQSEGTLLMLIQGHCDERGTEEYNRSLGERRALALREELVKAGVNPDRIRTISYGEDKPADSGHNEAAYSKNRRGVFVACTPK